MPRSRLHGFYYRPTMPNIIKVSQMEIYQKLRLLGSNPRSVYFGYSDFQIAKQISKNALHRYATELVLLNAIAKSDFEDVSELGSLEDESQNSNQNVQIQIAHDNKLSSNSIEEPIENAFPSPRNLKILADPNQIPTRKASID